MSGVEPEPPPLPCLRPGPSGVYVLVRVQPRASRERVQGIHDGALRLSVTAPPVDDKANGAVTRLLARLLGVPRRQVHLHGPGHSRSKTFLVTGLTVQTADEALRRVLDG